MYAVTRSADYQVQSATINGRHWSTGMMVTILGHAYTVAAISHTGDLALDGKHGEAHTIKARLVNEMIRDGVASVVGSAVIR